MHANLFINMNMETPDLVDVAGGRVAVFSARTPDPSRERNEDAAAVFGIDDKRSVLVLADGVGGVRGGDVAAATAIQELDRAIRKGLSSEQSLRASIIDGFENANRVVIENGLGSATTLAVLEIDSSTIRSYHAGDSPIIAVGQRGKVKLETVAHSPVGYAVQSGVIDEREAMNHSERHIVSNVVGDAEMHIEVGPSLPMARRDTVILASDGLTDNLHTHEIIEHIRMGAIEAAMKRLASTARTRMGTPVSDLPSKPDDLTFIIYRRTK